MKTESLVFSVTAALVVAAGSAGVQAADLPVPCGGGSCGGAVWVADASRAAATVTGQHLEITQLNERELFDWAEFNIGRDYSVNFDQPGADSVAINRIHQGSPSQIFGRLTADGSVYLLNPNGIVFGRDSQVNVRGLIAASMDMNPEAIENGILAPQLLQQRQPVFSTDGRVFVLDENGQTVTDEGGNPIAVKVVVEEGARIATTGEGGRVALLGQQVENAGSIQADKGQIILGAGEKIYLQASDDPELRGLLIEVDAGGEAWNKLTGNLSASQGNITMAGLLVTHDGSASATTSVSANGSVRLLARDTVDIQPGIGGVIEVNATNAGTLTLGGSSRIRISPDGEDGGLAVDEQTQSRSTVELMGRAVTLKTGAEILAESGEVTLTALADPSRVVPGGVVPLPEDPDSRIVIESGAVIDVSGAASTASVSRNIVSVELRANELRDAPLQRDGALRGETVRVDIRQGTDLADISGAVATIERGVNERLGEGGVVVLDSQGAVDLQDDSSIDVSGGELNYASGVVDSTILLAADGSTVRIEDADPNQTYTGVLQQPDNVATGVLESSYIEGFDAGTVRVAGRQLALNGELVGNATAGRLQQTASSAPRGGRLIIGDPDGQGLPDPDYKAPSLTLTNNISANLQPADRIDVSLVDLAAGGFTRAQFFSNGAIDVVDDITLAPGGELSLTGTSVDVAGNLTLPGGSIELRSAAVQESVNLADPTARAGVRLADDVTINVSGQWTGRSDAGSPVALDAGSVELAATAVDGELVLGDRVRISADAGAQRPLTGAVVKGSAGAVALDAGAAGVALETGEGVQLSAYGFDEGGSLEISANQLAVRAAGQPFAGGQRHEPGDPESAPYEITDELYGSGGFDAIALTATGTTLDAGATQPLTVEAGAELSAGAQRFAIDGIAEATATGRDIRDVVTFIDQPAGLLPRGSFAFVVDPNERVSNATKGGIDIRSGANIDAGFRGELSFTAPTSIDFNGILSARGGAIAARIVNPDTALDQGFESEQGIRVGSAAVLRVDGDTQFRPVFPGSALQTGDVADGGTIRLQASRGEIQLDAGSLLDVSGDVADIALLSSDGTYETRTVASRGGLIDLLAAEGILLDGELRGEGWENPAGPDVSGGSLNIGISRSAAGFNTEPDFLPSYPATERRIVVAADGQSVTQSPGTVVVDDDIALDGGFANLQLFANDRVEFAGDVELRVPNRLRVAAPNISAAPGTGTVDIAAAYLGLGPLSRATPLPQAAVGGDAVMNVSASLIDLVGQTAFQGFSDINLNSSGDIRAAGLAYGDGLTGSLAAGGNLTLRAAQVYPTSYSDFTILSEAPAGEIRIIDAGTEAFAPLSAQATLRIEADRIVQQGRIAAPLGRIVLDADTRLELADGSVTSTTADGPILFGRIQGSSEWVYETQPGDFDPIETPLEKQVALQSDDIEVADGALVDVSGGGDLLAYEFIPGPGGSVDALDPVNSNGRFYAIMPALGAGSGARDVQEFAGSDLAAGDTLTLLADVPALDLVAGEYTLLPARYALLPGAVLVEALPGQNLTTIATELVDGTTVVAGARSVAAADFADSLPGNYAVRDGSYARFIAEFDEQAGNDFFPASAAADDRVAPRVARDAGQLVVQVGNSLNLLGTLDAAADEGGRGASVDISAADLLVVDGAIADVSPAVEVSADQLEALNAESILLGGTRTRVVDGSLFSVERKQQLSTNLIRLGDGTELALEDGVLFALDSVTAAATQNLTVIGLASTSVAVAADTTLTAPELVLAAAGDIAVGSNAQLISAADAVTTNESLLIIDTDAANAGGVIARVSRGSQVDILRQADAASVGDYAAAAGAVLDAAGSVTINAAGSVRSESGFSLSSGSLSLGSNRVVLGADQADVVNGLALSNDDLAGFAALDELRLVSQQGIDIVAGAALDAGDDGSLGRLLLDTPALRGDGSSSRLSADTITILNNSGSVAAAPVPVSGTLSLDSETLQFGRGTVTVDGFTDLAITAGSQVVAIDDGRVVVPGNISFDTPLINGVAGSQLSFEAGGDIQAANLAGAAGAVADDSALGGALSLTATNVLLDTAVVLPSGTVAITASDGIVIDSDALVDVAGRQVELPGKRIDTPGGSVLLAAGGDIESREDSLVDVSGIGEAAAGSVALSADTLDLQGELRAASAAPSGGGWFSALVSSAGDIAALLDKVAAAGFSGAQRIETTSGDIELAAGDSIVAERVELVASGGSLTVAGTIDAASADGGRVLLAAGNDLIVSGAIDAAGLAGDGGDVSLAALGSINASGSTIDVSAADGRAGRVSLRATATADDVAIAAVPDQVMGADEIDIRAVQVFDVGPTVDSSVQLTVESALADYMASAPGTIAGRLGVVGDERYQVRPEAELRSPTDLTLASDWDFGSIRYSGQPGILTLRSAGNLNLSASLLDGFQATGFGAQARLLQLDGASWSFNAIAGADFSSARADATVGRGLVSADTGDLLLADNESIRAGTGDIRLAAARDIVLLGPKARIYTAGVAARPAESSGFGILAVTKNWSRDGGDIELSAGRDVQGAKVDQFLTGWTVRTGGPGSITDWAVDYDVLEQVGFQQVLAENFNQGIGTLAGGDIEISAGRDVASVFATVNSTGRETSAGSNTFETWGGGELNVRAGRDVIAGGFANVDGDSSVTARRSVGGIPVPGNTTLHPLLANAGGSMSLVSGNGMDIESFLNPGSISPSNLSGRVFFFLGDESDSLSLLSLGGDVTVFNQAGAYAAVVGSNNSQNTAGLGIFPASFGVLAPNGDVGIQNSIGLLPGSRGNLELVAGGNLRTASSDITIIMSDDDPASIPSPRNPFSNLNETRAAVSNSAGAAIHVGDDAPALLVAATGDIDGGIYDLAKNAFVFAGNDIRNVRLIAQNTSEQQATQVSAGRDIRFENRGAAIEVAGPGQLLVTTGRDANLGFSRGITTIGNTRNANLPSADGADISLYLGLQGNPVFGTDPLAADQLAELEAAYFDELEASGREAVDLLASDDQVRDFRALLDEAGLTPEDIGLTDAYLSDRSNLGVAQLYLRGVLATRDAFGFATLREEAAQGFVSDVAGLTPGAVEADIIRILRETNLISVADGSPDVVDSIEFPFTAGFIEAINQQYPETDIEALTALLPASPYDGDLNMAFSQVYTISGGDVDIFAPGGLINVGLANPPENSTIDKAPSELGIVAQGEGAVRMFTDGDVLVNQSRVFTLAGGDIIIWSSNGDIDAGRGAKSSISAPEPVITVDQDGQISVEFSDAIAGSGIRGILTGEDTEPGDVVLIAPTGDVNAGDAGIGSAGDALIAALRCIGCDNINIAGSIASPVVDTGAGLTGGLGALASVTASATRAAESSVADEAAGGDDSLAQAALGWLDGFVEGFGEDDEDDDNT